MNFDPNEEMNEAFHPELEQPENHEEEIIFDFSQLTSSSQFEEEPPVPEKEAPADIPTFSGDTPFRSEDTEDITPEIPEASPAEQTEAAPPAAETVSSVREEPKHEEKPTEDYLDKIKIALDKDEKKDAEPPRKSKTRAIKKGRPKRNNGEGLWGIPNILVTVVWCALTLLISLTLGRLVWVCAAEVLAFGREDKNVTITVYETDTIDDITKKLARAELIHYPGLFKLYAQFAVDDGDIHPGMWDLNTKYDYHALVKMMSPSSSREVVKVTIPEGYTCRQIFALLEENKVCTSKDIATYAAYGELGDYWFLEGVPRGDKYCLEGFLFPDTYEFYKNDSPKNILTRILNNFNNRFDESLRWQIQELNKHLSDLMHRNGYGQDYVNAHMFSVRDVVNVAAMIERETSSAQEGYTIASVIYNRLFCWGSNPPYLNIDATIVYALDGKNDLTYEDLRVDSPYNTYTNQGLPIGPIANPGLASLKAALAPSDTSYYFYVLDPAAGSHHFSTTQAEHDAFRATLGG